MSFLDTRLHLGEKFLENTLIMTTLILVQRLGPLRFRSLQAVDGGGSSRGSTFVVRIITIVLVGQIRVHPIVSQVDPLQ